MTLLVNTTQFYFYTLQYYFQLILGVVAQALTMYKSLTHDNKRIKDLKKDQNDTDVTEELMLETQEHIKPMSINAPFEIRKSDEEAEKLEKN